MEIKLTNLESEEFFYRALCNGLSYLNSHGIVLDYDSADYKKAKESLKSESNQIVCYEDVLMRILKDGGELQIVDEEGDEYNGVITLADVHERVQHSPQERLIEMENEEDDAITADCILQTVLFEDVIFG